MDAKQESKKISKEKLGADDSDLGEMDEFTEIDKWEAEDETLVDAEMTPAVGKYMCRLCKSSFEDCASLYHHGLMHPDDCVFCSDSTNFATKKLKRKHEWEHVKGTLQLEAQSGAQTGIKCDLCDAVVLKIKDMVAHQTYAHICYDEDPPYGCEICDQSFDRAVDLGKHRFGHVQDGGLDPDGQLDQTAFAKLSDGPGLLLRAVETPPHRCLHCQLVFWDTGPWAKHMETEHGQREDCHEEDAWRNGLKRMLRCLQCPTATFATEEAFLAHAASHPQCCSFCNAKVNFPMSKHKERHCIALCNVCFKPSNTSYRNLLHQTLQHISQTDMTCCEICGKEFVVPAQLAGHRQLHITDRSLRIDGNMDLAKFKGRPLFPTAPREDGEDDEDGTDGEPPFQCLECMVVCNSALQLYQHKATHPKRTKCNKCGLECESKVELRKHLITHGAGGLCCLCGVTFKGEAKLQAHISLVHPKFVPERCSVCHLTFTNDKEWQKHTVMHTQMYKCKLCPLTFTSWKLYIVHRNGHRAAFRCKVCHLNFGLLRALNGHRKSVHGLRPLDSAEYLKAKQSTTAAAVKEESKEPKGKEEPRKPTPPKTNLAAKVTPTPPVTVAPVAKSGTTDLMARALKHIEKVWKPKVLAALPAQRPRGGGRLGRPRVVPTQSPWAPGVCPPGRPSTQTLGDIPTRFNLPRKPGLGYVERRSGQRPPEDREPSPKRFRQSRWDTSRRPKQHQGSVWLSEQQASQSPLFTRDLPNRRQEDARDFLNRRQEDARDFMSRRQEEGRNFNRRQEEGRDFDNRRQEDDHDFNYRRQDEGRDFNNRRQDEGRDFNNRRQDEGRNFNNRRQDEGRDFNNRRQDEGRDFNNRRQDEDRDFNNRQDEGRDFSNRRQDEGRDFNNRRQDEGRNFNNRRQDEGRDFNNRRQDEGRDFNNRRQDEGRDFNNRRQDAPELINRNQEDCRDLINRRLDEAKAARRAQRTASEEEFLSRFDSGSRYDDRDRSPTKMFDWGTEVDNARSLGVEDHSARGAFRSDRHDRMESKRGASPPLTYEWVNELSKMRSLGTEDSSARDVFRSGLDEHMQTDRDLSPSKMLEWSNEYAKARSLGTGHGILLSDRDDRIEPRELSPSKIFEWGNKFAKIRSMESDDKFRSRTNDRDLSPSKMFQWDSELAKRSAVAEESAARGAYRSDRDLSPGKILEWGKDSAQGNSGSSARGVFRDADRLESNRRETYSEETTSSRLVRFKGSEDEQGWRNSDRGDENRKKERESRGDDGDGIWSRRFNDRRERGRRGERSRSRSRDRRHGGRRSSSPRRPAAPTLWSKAAPTAAVPPNTPWHNNALFAQWQSYMASLTNLQLAQLASQTVRPERPTASQGAAPANPPWVPPQVPSWFRFPAAAPDARTNPQNNPTSR